LSSALAGPAPPHQVGVPPQQCAWRDQHAKPASLRQDPGQRRHHRAVSPRQARLGDLPAQHRELVAQDQDFDVFGLIGTAEQDRPTQEPNEDQIQQSKSHKPDPADLTVGTSGQRQTRGHRP
jgi:hypothetical protein